MIRKIAFTLILFMSFSASNAHPSWGMVVDSKGLIYFVDVLHHNGTLWRFDPDSRDLRALIKGNFHAHSLQIDDADNLYIGTQLWIDGEIMGDGQNCLIRYQTKNGHIDTLLYSEDYDVFFGGNVLYDNQESKVYYPHENKLRVRNLKSRETRLALDHQFERLCTTTYGPQGELWISDAYANEGSIYSWKEGSELKQIHCHVFAKEPEAPVYKERSHSLIYGMTVSPKGNVVYCESAHRAVHEVRSNGRDKILYQSPEHYFPTGIFFANKKMYVMEVGFIPGKGHVGPNLLIVAGNKKIKYELEFD